MMNITAVAEARIITTIKRVRKRVSLVVVQRILRTILKMKPCIRVAIKTMRRFIRRDPKIMKMSHKKINRRKRNKSKKLANFPLR